MSLGRWSRELGRYFLLPDYGRSISAAMTLAFAGDGAEASGHPESAATVINVPRGARRLMHCHRRKLRRQLRCPAERGTRYRQLREGHPQCAAAVRERGTGVLLCDLVAKVRETKKFSAMRSGSRSGLVECGTASGR